MEPLVVLEGVCKQFASRCALEAISAVFPSKARIGVVGPDGAGKTTLMRLLAALLLPTKGRIRVDGCDTEKQADSVHGCIGYMPQKFGLYESLTVAQNLDLYANLRNVVGSEKKDRCRHLLAFTKLEEFSHRLAKHLSGGMKQKLAIACALVKKPKLLLLDEPTVGVDPLSRRDLWNMVTELLQEEITVVWSTAYLDEAEQCDQVLLLHEGKLLYEGAPKEWIDQMKGRVFLTSHSDPDRRNRLSQLLKEPNIVDGVIQGKGFRIITREKESISSSLWSRHCLEAREEGARFEDAFIDHLGGGPGSRSALAEKARETQSTSAHPIIAYQLTKQFGSFVAVSEVSFQVERGKIFGLLGPNGAGKTTTFKMLCGLLAPSSGRALVNNIDLAQAPKLARSTIGYMAQKFSLYGHLNVLQNLYFFAGIYNVSRLRRKERVEEMIEIFELGDFLSFSVGKLPLGYQQRLSLACANIHSPTLLFLDEPTSGVDPIARREFWNHIHGLVEKGVTVMITTHFMDEAEYCDQIALVYRGTMIALETPDELKSRTSLPRPTLEEAFIQRIQEYDAKSR